MPSGDVRTSVAAINSSAKSIRVAALSQAILHKTRPRPTYVLGLCGQEAQEYQGCENAVAAETQPTVGGVLGVKCGDLPGELAGAERDAEISGPSGLGQRRGNRQTSDRQRIEQPQRRLGAWAESARRGLDPDEGVVGLVLMRVDGVIAEGPGDAGGIHRQGRCG